MGDSDPSVEQRVTDGPLGVVLSVDTTVAAAQLSGELDRLNAPRLRALLDQLRASGHIRVSLDVSRLDFVDAAGLAVLATVDDELRGAGGGLVLVRATPWIARVLRAVSMDGLLG